MPTDVPPPPLPGPPANSSALSTIAGWVVILAGLWYLLGALEAVLKPFFLAVMLGYGILPLYLKLKARTGRIPAVVLMAAGSVLIAVTVTLVFTSSIVQLNAQYPALRGRFESYQQRFTQQLHESYPHLTAKFQQVFRGDDSGEDYLRGLLNHIGRTIAGVVSTAAVVTLYLIFMLVEAGRFPERLMRSFPQRHLSRISETIHTIGRAMTEYIGGKLLSSLVLALPVGVLLELFNVELAPFWALLTFFCNFVPYFGSAVACGSPLAFAFLKLDYGWEPFTLGVLLVGIHTAAALFVEPVILGKAVGLSPLLILLALTFWGSCWGFIGILLAVPLSAMFIIVLQNIPATRPVGLLLADG